MSMVLAPVTSSHGFCDSLQGRVTSGSQTEAELGHSVQPPASIQNSYRSLHSLRFFLPSCLNPSSFQQNTNSQAWCRIIRYWTSMYLQACGAEGVASKQASGGWGAPLSSGRGTLLEFFLSAQALSTLPAFSRQALWLPQAPNGQTYRARQAIVPHTHPHQAYIQTKRLTWGCTGSQALPPPENDSPELRKAPIVAWGPSCIHKGSQVP